MTPRLARAYRQTSYRVGDILFRVGRRSPEMDRVLCRLGARSAVLITAHNPFSRRMPAAWNNRMQARLLERLRRVQFLHGTGEWRGWSENHLLVLGHERRSIQLAILMRQNGIVILRKGQPVSVFVTCYCTRSSSPLSMTGV